MAMLIMNSLEIQKHFIETELPADKTLFVCMSLTLEMDVNDPRVIRVKDFVPSVELCSLFEDAQHDAYRTKYAQFIQHAPLRATLATFAKHCINDEQHVVLLCSVNESEFGYLNIIADYMEIAMGFKVYDPKTYIRDKKKNKLVSNFNTETINKIDAALSKAKLEEPEIESIVDYIINGSQYEAQRMVEEEKKRRKKKKKRDEKKRSKRGLVLDDIELLSGR